MNLVVIVIYIVLCAASLIVAYAKPGVKLLKGRNLMRFTLMFDLFALLLRRRSLSVAEIVVLGAATLASLAISRTWILFRLDLENVNQVFSRCLTMTRTPFRRDQLNYSFVVAQRRLGIQLATPFPTVALVVFRGDWRYTKAQVLRQLLGKNFKPVVPRYVIRLGGRNAESS